MAKRANPCANTSLLLLTSGAIQYGVPIIEWRFVVVSVSCAVAPKSESLIVPPLETRMFFALTSRWMRRCARGVDVDRRAPPPPPPSRRGSGTE